MSDILTEYDTFQQSFRQRYFCIGWRELGSQVKHYYPAVFDDWHEAYSVSDTIQKSHPEMICFVDSATKTKTCPRCNGSIVDPQTEDTCAHCHAKGIVLDWSPLLPP